MKINLSINYRTNWGESVCAEIILQKKNGATINRSYNLETTNGENWYAEIMLNDKDAVRFSYNYIIRREGIVVRQGWMGSARSFRYEQNKSLVVRDFWRDIPMQAHLYSSAYSHLSHLSSVPIYDLPYYNKTIMLRVHAPQLQEGQCLGIVGGIPLLGMWDANHPLRLEKSQLHEWCISLSADSISLPFDYKYVVLDEATGKLIAWEGGDNRSTGAWKMADNEAVALFDDDLRMEGPHWKAAGVVVPLFSLRSEGSQGVGDFGDLRMMVDWANKTKMKIIQLLPIYDTTQTNGWMDSYPYNSISIYALHPMYIDLRQLSRISDEDFLHRYETERERINGEFTVDYVKANKLKHAYLHRLFEQEFEEVAQTAAYKQFFDANAQWLIPYAAFSYLRDKHQTSDFNTWPEFAQYDASEIARFSAPSQPHYKSIAYYYYIQYQLDRQLHGVSEYARAHKVVLKGDIPIGISRSSVEAWVEPHLFHMNGQAGAPPDAFCREGQNWGFPTYNWEKMSEDGYQWWKNRLGKMAEFFDAYRIDHVLGFFRIWEIPMHAVDGLLGQFSPSLPMTKQEIESYGMKLNEEFLLPVIYEGLLYDVFGRDLMNRVREEFLVVSGRDRYQLKEEFNTQRKVEAHFAGQDDAESLKIKKGLFSLISNVLFIRDKDDANRFHPRIGIVDEPLLTLLPAAEQDAFRSLYFDYYYRRHNEFWYTEAKKKLPALVESTTMLCCAEDLGMVPACVRPLMDELHMLSLEIQTMPKEEGITFGHLENNPYRSVATIFTHDMATLRMWWEEDQQRTQQFYHEILQKDGLAPDSIPGWLCEEVVARHLFSPSMLCLISLQNWLSIDDTLRYPDPSEERINIPACAHHYWRYRMPLYIEQLLAADSFNTKIATLINHSARE